MSKRREEIDIRILNNYVDTSNDEVIEAFRRLTRVIDRVNQPNYEVECPIEDLQMFKVSTNGVKTVEYSADSKEDQEQYRSGLIFRTKNLAEEFLKRQQLIFRINGLKMLTVTGNQTGKLTQESIKSFATLHKIESLSLIIPGHIRCRCCRISSHSRSQINASRSSVMRF